MTEYTREQILAMPAGRELDALVEQYVFGKQIEWSGDPTELIPLVPAEYGYIVDYYSTDISAAWEVVEKMHKWGGCEIACCGTNDKRWYVVQTYTDSEMYQKGITVTCPTATEAICKAALLAVKGL